MSYNADLQNNNADLQGILNIINTLPEAGISSVSNIAYGTFTIDTRVNTNTIAIEHGLGCTPDLVVVFAVTNQSSTANKGQVAMAFDTIAMRRYSPSASNAITVTTLEDSEVGNWANDTTFTMAYNFWYYGVGDHHWFAIKRGT